MPHVLLTQPCVQCWPAGTRVCTTWWSACVPACLPAGSITRSSLETKLPQSDALSSHGHMNQRRVAKGWVMPRSWDQPQAHPASAACKDTDHGMCSELAQEGAEDKRNRKSCSNCQSFLPGVHRGTKRRLDVLDACMRASCGGRDSKLILAVSECVCAAGACNHDDGKHVFALFHCCVTCAEQAAAGGRCAHERGACHDRCVACSMRGARQRCAPVARSLLYAVCHTVRAACGMMHAASVSDAVDEAAAAPSPAGCALCCAGSAQVLAPSWQQLQAVRARKQRRLTAAAPGTEPEAALSRGIGKKKEGSGQDGARAGSGAVRPRRGLQQQWDHAEGKLAPPPPEVAGVLFTGNSTGAAPGGAGDGSSSSGGGSGTPASWSDAMGLCTDYVPSCALWSAQTTAEGVCELGWGMPCMHAEACCNAKQRCTCACTLLLSAGSVHAWGAHDRCACMRCVLVFHLPRSVLQHGLSVAPLHAGGVPAGLRLLHARHE